MIWTKVIRLELWQSAPGRLNAGLRLAVAATLVSLVSIGGISIGAYDDPSAQFRKALDIARTATTYTAYSRAAKWYAKAAAQGFALPRTTLEPANRALALLDVGTSEQHPRGSPTGPQFAHGPISSTP